MLWFDSLIYWVYYIEGMVLVLALVYFTLITNEL